MVWIGRFAGTALLKYVASPRLLSIYAVVAAALCAVAVFGDGAYVIYALGGIGFFMSIMFPTIFSLSVKDMDDQTPAASGLLCLSIVGGAVIPVLTGLFADATNLHLSMVVPVVCYLVIVAFGLKCTNGTLENGYGRIR